MRRAAFIAVAASAVLAVPAGVSAAGRELAVPAVRHALVTVSDCHPADELAQRYASFSGQMRAYPGTARMMMRFTLLERLGGLTGFQPVPLQDLRPWRRSKPGARTFIYTQRVTALRDGGAYRMRVQFRWYGAHGTLLRTRFAHSRVCSQPAPLPNLTIGGISSAAAATPDQRLYSITVTNSGDGEARNVEVALKVDGTVVGATRVDLLPADESTVAQISGPQCAFDVRAIADPDRRIRETSDADNTLTVPCAQAGG
ncbi:MAG TPA: CARDB domain-containing protein [Thermoleophilaceae bacterium]|nr:CARDB domain-containing protein [Thermoleophilaceae bacterium]